MWCLYTRLYVWLKDVVKNSIAFQKIKRGYFVCVCVYLHDERHPNLSIGVIPLLNHILTRKTCRLGYTSRNSPNLLVPWWNHWNMCTSYGEPPCVRRGQGNLHQTGLWWDSPPRSRTPSTPSQSPPVASSNGVQEVNHGRIFIPRRQAIDPPPRSHCIHAFFCVRLVYVQLLAACCVEITRPICINKNSSPDPWASRQSHLSNLLVSSFHPHKKKHHPQTALLARKRSQYPTLGSSENHLQTQLGGRM